MIEFSDSFQKLLKIKGPSSAQFRRVFVTFNRDLHRAWRSSTTYRSYSKFRKAVTFLVKIDGNLRVRVIVLVKLVSIAEVKERQIVRKPKKLLYSKKISDKIGGVELKMLLPKQKTKKPKAAQNRQDSYLETLRQRALERQKKSAKKKDFGVKERASRWGTGGRVFDTNRTSYRWGSKGKTYREPKKALSWGTKAVSYKQLRKNVRWGTLQKQLDRDTNETWGTEADKRIKVSNQDTEDLNKYKLFIISLHREKFIKKLLKQYGQKLLNFLISKLE